MKVFFRWAVADDAVAAVFTGLAGKPLQPSGVEKMLKRDQHKAFAACYQTKFRCILRGGSIM